MSAFLVFSFFFYVTLPPFSLVLKFPNLSEGPQLGWRGERLYHFASQLCQDHRLSPDLAGVVKFLYEHPTGTRTVLSTVLLLQ
ncbi:hypothetical protein HOY80DRAFT_979908 [Tuber brumale]|nr:hypothetical protein HOY80DRAFT_979908 [Tuber brumale]